MTRAAMLRSQGASQPAVPIAAPNPTPPQGAASVPPPATVAGTPPAASTAAAPGPAPAGTAQEHAFDILLREIQVLRTQQERILALLASPPRAQASSVEREDEGIVSPIRARHRKSVVLIDDDPETRDAAAAELRQADVPVRVFAAGREGIAAIAEEKPDVVALELGLAGEMEGRDVINMIKATMEWIDIRIVLWTREQVPNQKDARQVHGADEIVSKSAGAAALVARIITLFRRVH